MHLAKGRLLAVNVRSTRSGEGPPGQVATLRDTTELHALEGRAEGARERLRLLYEAGVRIGTTLDVTRTAEELTEVAVPRFAEFATVELLDPVLRGEEPSAARTDMRRTAMSGVRATARRCSRWAPWCAAWSRCADMPRKRASTRSWKPICGRPTTGWRSSPTTAGRHWNTASAR